MPAGVLDFSQLEPVSDELLVPAITIDNAVVASSQEAISFEARDGAIWANGLQFSVRGVNWYGSESRTGAPNGLNRHSLHHYLRFLADEGFNAIRLLFNHESALANRPIEDGDLGFAPELRGARYRAMFGLIADAAAVHNLLIVIACHRIGPNKWPGDGLWYDGTVSEMRVKESWGSMARELCTHTSIFAADLQNEPHHASWGKGVPTDWDRAAKRIGDHVNGLCPRWLIMVEGVGAVPGAPGLDSSSEGVFWGEK